MVLGVDSQGQIFWFYPRHEDAAKNPVSIEIRAGSQPIELLDQVSHEPSEGPFRIFGLFSPKPLDVRGVEEVVAHDLRNAQSLEKLTRLGIGDVGQHSILLMAHRSGWKKPN